MSIPERRQCSRVSMEGLRGRIGPSQSMQVLDLSAGGARIESHDAIAPGRCYRFQVGGIWIAGKVVHCALVRLEPDEEGGRAVFEARIAFQQPSRADEQQLVGLMEDARLAATGSEQLPVM
jgi:hypothetical protein